MSELLDGMSLVCNKRGKAMGAEQALRIRQLEDKVGELKGQRDRHHANWQSAMEQYKTKVRELEEANLKLKADDVVYVSAQRLKARVEELEGLMEEQSDLSIFTEIIAASNMEQFEAIKQKLCERAERLRGIVENTLNKGSFTEQ